MANRNSDSDAWDYVPSALDDPFGFLFGWLRRGWKILVLLGYIAGGAYVVWALLAGRRVPTGVLLEASFFFVLITLLVWRDARRARHRREE